MPNHLLLKTTDWNHLLRQLQIPLHPLSGRYISSPDHHLFVQYCAVPDYLDEKSSYLLLYGNYSVVLPLRAKRVILFSLFCAYLSV